MKLTKFLREQGYDLIEGPVRNHKPLQLWLKQIFDETELYYANVNQAFTSSVVLEEIENTSLSIDSSKKDEYGFNIGITILDEILESIGLGTVELSSKITSGKTISISYEDAITREYAIGNIENYFAAADFVHANPSLLKNANKNNILILTGVVFAKNLQVTIATDFTINPDLVVSLNAVAEGKLDFTVNDTNNLNMVSSGNGLFPIAIKASRLDFDKGVFKKLKLVTDNRNFF
ncbi:MAG: hypothetical protein KBC56_05250 [Flavobacterium sp.]|nr:hypothetical protein [Flavobacterium sp.]